MFISCVLMGKAHWRGPFPICGAGVSYCLVWPHYFENAPTLPYLTLPYPTLPYLTLPYPTLGVCLTQKLGKTKQVLLHVSDQIAGCCGSPVPPFIIDKPMGVLN